MRAAARTRALAGATTDATRAIEGTLLDGELVFNVGALPRAARVEVSYDTIVTPAAKPGRANTQVFASAQTPVGERMLTVPVDVDVVVIDDPFTNAQVLLGRVFLDRNGNSRLDRGEAGAPNVRVVTATGLSAVTDAQGHYSFPALSAGSVAVGIDPDTMPDGWGMPTGGRTLTATYASCGRHLAAVDCSFRTSGFWQPPSHGVRIRLRHHRSHPPSWPPT
jgi:uncharacterized protein (DUF2141 family)